MNAHPAGHERIRFHDEARGRPVLVDAWYPARPGTIEAAHAYGLGRGRVAEGAAATDGPRPVIVMSHGAFGAADNYARIGEHLARRGYLVIGVSHFGESYMYGPETIDPTSATRPWTRPKDCSFALDAMSRHATFGAVVDDSRVGALGHSFGRRDSHPARRRHVRPTRDGALLLVGRGDRPWLRVCGGRTRAQRARG